ncbi:MAG: lysozyme inhibitor LprI family protein [Pyrinomonadaceae bacterium]
MKRILIGVIVVICSLSANSLSQEKRGSEVPCGETGTQAEANACARLEYQKADAEMNKLYGRLMTELADYKGNDQQKLQRAQALWLQYRDANCESEASIYQGGSIRPAVYNSCLASVTRERTQRMAEFLAATTQ